MTEGRADSALTELNRLVAPATQAGKEFWPAIEMMKRIARALVYTKLGRTRRHSPNGERYVRRRRLCRSSTRFGRWPTAGSS